MNSITKLIFYGLLAFYFLVPSLCMANTFDDSGLLGEPEEVMVLPNRMNGQLIGIKFLTIIKEGNVGTAFLWVTSFYRLDEHKITEDSSYFLINGFLSDKIAEIENNSYEQDWSADQGLVKQFDALVRKASDGNATVEELKKIYHKFRFSPFNQKIGEKRNLGHKEIKWFLGKEVYEGVPFMLNASKLYGNRFTSTFDLHN